MPEQQSDRAVVQIRPAVLNKPDAARYLGIGLTKFDELRRDGKFPTFELGGRVVFRVSDLDAYVASLEPLRISSS